MAEGRGGKSTARDTGKECPRTLQLRWGCGFGGVVSAPTQLYGHAPTTSSPSRPKTVPGTLLTARRKAHQTPTHPTHTTSLHIHTKPTRHTAGTHCAWKSQLLTLATMYRRPPSVYVYVLVSSAYDTLTLVGVLQASGGRVGGYEDIRRLDCRWTSSAGGMPGMAPCRKGSVNARDTRGGQGWVRRCTSTPWGRALRRTGALRHGLGTKWSC